MAWVLHWTISIFLRVLFCAMCDSFWNMIFKWRWLFLSSATIFYAYRMFQLPFPADGYRLAIESNLWVISIFAFGYKYLNQPSKSLDYLSQAAYPVYILHMIFLFLGSILIFPLNIPVGAQFILVLLFTGVGCFTTYEFIIRRINIIRPLFGLKLKSTKTSN